MLLSNPPWIDQVLRNNWRKLASRVSEDALPRPMEGRRIWKFEEFGTGHYGAVYPTNIPGLVFKITSDFDEARFVQFALNQGWIPDGMVQYVGVLEFPDVTYRRRRTFALWREEAIDFDQNEVYRKTQNAYRRREMYRSVRMLQIYKIVSHAVRMAAKKNPRALVKALSSRALQERAWQVASEIYRDYSQIERIFLKQAVSMFEHGYRRTYAPKYDRAEKIAIGLDTCRYIAQEMGSTEGLSEIGTALEYYQENGMLLADVHMANIGLATRPDYSEPIPVIRDPGHAVPLTPEAQNTIVPVLL